MANALTSNDDEAVVEGRKVEVEREMRDRNIVQVYIRSILLVVVRGDRSDVAESSCSSNKRRV